MKHFAINETTPSKQAFKIALAQAVASAVNSGAAEVLLLVPAKGNLGPSIIEDVLGRQCVSKLKNGESIRVSRELTTTVRARTARTLELAARSKVVLAAFFPPDDLQLLLKRFDPDTEVIYLGWLDAELDEWKNLHNPELIEVPPPVSGDA